MNKTKQYANYSLELRVYPNRSQEEYLSKLFGCSRYIYNHSLAKTVNNYKETNEFIFYNDLATGLVALKKQTETSWLKEVDSTSLQQSLKNLNCALDNYLKSKKGKRRGKPLGFPNFKSKSNRQSCKLMAINNNIKLDLEKQTLKIPKIKQPLKVVDDGRRPEGEISSITLKKNPSGKYFVSILFKQEKPINDYQADLSRSVGLDFGLKTFITKSDGDEIASPLFLKKSLKKLKRKSRQHSKKKINSCNRMKSRLHLARLHEKIANQRKDFNHKLSSKLLNDYDFIFIEDLNIEGMKKRWGRKVSDLSYSQFVNFLTYKAINQNKFVLKIDRWFPSSKLCSSCGFKNTNLTLADRNWICPDCGKNHNRDTNAAINILNEGLKQFKNTAGTAEIYALGDQQHTATQVAV